MTAPLLDVRGLAVHFPLRAGILRRREVIRAVDGVDLTIGQGETLALVGESGSGKSTTGYAILGMVEPTGGSVTFEGEDITHAAPARRRALARRMQIVFQDPAAALDPRMRVGASIEEPLIIQGIGTGPSRRARVAELLALVGLGPEHAERLPSALSGGQRQRVVIARALALEPKLIVCDEAVSALDVSIRSQVLNLLMKLKRELGLAYLFISHDLSVVRHIADRVTVMLHGKIVESGATEQVFASPRHAYTRELFAAIPTLDPRRRHLKTAMASEAGSAS